MYNSDPHDGSKALTLFSLSDMQEKIGNQAMEAGCINISTD